MRSRSWVLVVAFCSVITACESYAAPRVERRIVGGAEIVVNQESEEFERIRMEHLWTMEVGTTGSHLWEDPRFIRESAGQVFVLDQMADVVYQVDPGSQMVVDTIGGPGEGPGEFRRSFGLVARGGEVLVGDGGGAEIEVFDRGEPARSIPLNALVFSLEPATSDLAISRFYSEDGTDLRLIDLESGREVPYTTPPIPMASEEPLDESCVRTHGGDSSIVRTLCNRILYQILDLEGQVQREVRLQREVPAIPESMLEEYLEQARSMLLASGFPTDRIDQQMRSEEDRLRRNPRIRGTRIDKERGVVAVWSQLPDEVGDEAAHLHLFDKEGEYLGQAEARAPWRDFVIENGTIWALEVDPETDLAALVSYRLFGDPAGDETQ